MSDHTSLKGVTNIDDTQLNNELQDNVVEFFDWALLNIGNYYNVTLGDTDYNGNDYSKLRIISDNPNYVSGQAWEGFRGNWVWQSGISYDPAPIVGSDSDKPGIFGVFVNGDFHPSDATGQYAHKVDHFNGRVIFESPIPEDSLVQAEYSYKRINVVYADAVPWVREVQYNTGNIPASFKEDGKGDYEIPSEMRMQLPAIAVEIVPRRTYRGYQLGGGQFVYNDVLFHCIAESSIDVNQMVDIVANQNDKTIFMFNSNTMAASGDFPLDWEGIPVSGAKRYPEIIETYADKRLRFTNSRVSEVKMINTNFNAGIVRITTEVINDHI
jgi:hypothetical protein